MGSLFICSHSWSNSSLTPLLRSGFSHLGETEPAELLPEHLVAAREAAAPAGEIWFFQHQTSDSQRSDRPAAGRHTCPRLSCLCSDRVGRGIFPLNHFIGQILWLSCGCGVSLSWLSVSVWKLWTFQLYELAMNQGDVDISCWQVSRSLRLCFFFFFFCSWNIKQLSDLSALISCVFQLIENGAFTFEQLLYKAVQDNPDSASSAIEKAKHRVLKVRQSLRTT